MRTARTFGKVMAAGLMVSLLSCGDSSIQNDSSILRRGLSGEPATLDPAAVADTFSHEVIRDLYEGLTAESPTGTILPGVATSWDVDATGTRYTFHLRTDARWSNGKPVTAHDFVLAWQRALDPKRGSPEADLLHVIAGAADIVAGKAPITSLGARALSDTMLEVTLEQPAPYFPGLLAHAPAYPVYSDASARSHDPKGFISNGAYVLSRWLPGTTVTLTRNPYYWDRDNVHIARVEYQVVSDDSAQLRRYRAGGLEMTDNVPANELPTLRREHAQELKIAPYLATAYYGLNLTAAPFAHNAQLRQALAMAIDRHRLVQQLGGGQSGAYGLVAPGTWNYTPQAWDWQALSDTERIAQAQKLYAQAGYSSRSPLRLRVLYNTNPGIRDTAIVIAAMWKEVLGIDTKLEDQEYRVFLETRHDKSQWQIARLSWAADYDDAGNFLDALRKTSINNDESYANPAFDALLDEAAHTPDAQVRREKLQAAERLMLADYPIIPLYHFVSKHLVKPYVKGLQVNPLNHIASKALSLSPH
ncbi:MAG TPA: peptide ABC transporter substrate-binding protein [Steroidobacteraceae bacterium]